MNNVTKYLANVNKILHRMINTFNTKYDNVKYVISMREYNFLLSEYDATVALQFILVGTHSI